jgi:hypothetical protein
MTSNSPTAPDWSQVYRASRARMETTARTSLLLGWFCGVGGLVGGLLPLGLLGIGALPIALVCWLLGSMLAGIFTLGGRQQRAGDPVVVSGLVIGRAMRIVGLNTRQQMSEYYLQMHLFETFMLVAGGQHYPLFRQGAAEVRVNARLYDRLHENEQVTLICRESKVGTLTAFARLEDLRG